jgi:hypothetical protein
VLPQRVLPKDSSSACASGSPPGAGGEFELEADFVEHASQSDVSLTKENFDKLEGDLAGVGALGEDGEPSAHMLPELQREKSTEVNRLKMLKRDFHADDSELQVVNELAARVALLKQQCDHEMDVSPKEFEERLRKEEAKCARLKLSARFAAQQAISAQACEKMQLLWRWYLS